MTTQERELVRQIAEGNEEAEKEILLLYQDKIKLTIRHKIGLYNPDVEDLLQEVLWALIQNLRDNKFDESRKTSLISYILGITHNKIRAYYEAGNKVQKVRLNPAATSNPISEDESPLEKEELQNALKTLLGNLPVKYQEVLYLKFYEGFTVKEIAKELKIPSRRVSECIHYGLHLLRKKCKKTKFFSIFLPFLLIYKWSFLK